MADSNSHVAHDDTEEEHEAHETGDEEDKEGKDKEEEGEFTVKALTLELFNDSTGHGLPRIVGARGNVTRVFWIILFSGAMAAFIYNTYTIVDQYLSFEVAIGTDVEFK
jgi:hypothetical protein